MREDAEQGDAGEGADKQGGDAGATQEEEEGEGGAEELWKVDQKVLVEGVNTVLGEIGGVGVVKEVVEGRDDGVGEDAGEGEIAGRVGRSVDADGYEGCEESRSCEEDEREGPAEINESAAQCGRITHFRLKCGSSSSAGSSKNAGKVMRLKTPTTSMQPSMDEAKMLERFCRLG